MTLQIGDIGTVPRKDGSFTLVRLDAGGVLQPVLEVTPGTSSVSPAEIADYVQAVLEFLNFRRMTLAAGGKVQLSAT